MKRSRIAGEALLLFLAFFLPGYISQAGFAASGPATSLTLLQSIATGIPQFLLMAYVAGVSGPASSERWGFVPFKKTDAFRVGILVLACFAAVTPFVTLVLALPAPWSKAFAMGYRWGLHSPSQIPLGLLFGLTAGYREEFFFRAYLLGRLEEIGASRAIAGVSAVALFSIGHLYEGILGVSIAAALGAVFTIAYMRRKNLHVVAIAHGVYNTVILCLSLLVPRTLPDATLMRIFFSA